MGVWAGEDSPSKRDRQPSLVASALRTRCEAAALPLKRGNKKAQIPTLPRTEADCTGRRQPSTHSNVYNLVSALKNNSCVVSVYCAVDFVNRQFVTSMAT